jgi:hypothetical protein
VSSLVVRELSLGLYILAVGALKLVHRVGGAVAATKLSAERRDCLPGLPSVYVGVNFFLGEVVCVPWLYFFTNPALEPWEGVRSVCVWKRGRREPTFRGARRLSD